VRYDAVYDPETDFDAWYTHATFRAIRPWIRPGDRVLELGCATGLMTASLAGLAGQIVAVDRSASYLEAARQRGLSGVRWVEADIATYDDGESYDHVVATGVIQHFADPLTLLRSAAARLAPGGLLHITAPNPRSIHRLVALEMGLIADLADRSERNLRFGVLALIEADEVRRLAEQIGLCQLHREGVCLKPLPNEQMAALPPDVLEGFERAARWLPDYSAMTYLIFGAS
jgi:2-polyprenyl-3-methyl-5-hydroxy-6-metoxy-1,4-benzoquinol methylase